MCKQYVGPRRDSPAGKHTAKPVTSTSNEILTIVHVNEKHKCVKIPRTCTLHTQTHAEEARRARTENLVTHRNSLNYMHTSHHFIHLGADSL